MIKQTETEQSVCCEPTGEMVGALREVLAMGGRPVGAGIARAALTAALMVQHEQHDDKAMEQGDRMQWGDMEVEILSLPTFWGDFVEVLKPDGDTSLIHRDELTSRRS